MKSEAKTVSAYTEKVLNANKALKVELNSVGAVRSLLLEHATSIKLSSQFKTFLLLTKKDKQAYELLDKSTRRSKSGRVGAFTVLQALYKLEKQGFKAVEVKTETSAKTTKKGA